MKIIAKEILFVFVAILTAIPIGILFLYLMDLKPISDGVMTSDEKVLEMDLLLIGGVLGFVGVYITRGIVWAVRKLFIS